MGVSYVQTLVIPADMLDALLGSLAARPADALWDTPTLHLATAVPILAKGMVLADFTEADFSGYVDAALTFSAVESGGPNSRGISAAAYFAATTATPFVANTIVGIYVTDGTGAVLYGAQAIDPPVQFSAPGDWQEFVLQFALGAQQQG